MDLAGLQGGSTARMNRSDHINVFSEYATFFDQMIFASDWLSMNADQLPIGFMDMSDRSDTYVAPIQHISQTDSREVLSGNTAKSNLPPSLLAGNEKYRNERISSSFEEEMTLVRSITETELRVIIEVQRQVYDLPTIQVYDSLMFDRPSTSNVSQPTGEASSSQVPDEPQNDRDTTVSPASEQQINQEDHQVNAADALDIPENVDQEIEIDWDLLVDFHSDDQNESEVQQPDAGSLEYQRLGQEYLSYTKLKQTLEGELVTAEDAATRIKELEAVLSSETRTFLDANWHQRESLHSSRKREKALMEVREAEAKHEKARKDAEVEAISDTTLPSGRQPMPEAGELDYNPVSDNISLRQEAYELAQPPTTATLSFGQKVLLVDDQVTPMPVNSTSPQGDAVPAADSPPMLSSAQLDSQMRSSFALSQDDQVRENVSRQLVADFIRDGAQSNQFQIPNLDTESTNESATSFHPNHYSPKRSRSPPSTRSFHRDRYSPKPFRPRPSSRSFHRDHYSPKRSQSPPPARSFRSAQYEHLPEQTRRSYGNGGRNSVGYNWFQGSPVASAPLGPSGSYGHASERGAWGGSGAYRHDGSPRMVDPGYNAFEGPYGSFQTQSQYGRSPAVTNQGFRNNPSRSRPSFNMRDNSPRSVHRTSQVGLSPPSPAASPNALPSNPTSYSKAVNDTPLKFKLPEKPRHLGLEVVAVEVGNSRRRSEAAEILTKLIKGDLAYSHLQCVLDREERSKRFRVTGPPGCKSLKLIQGLFTDASVSFVPENELD